MAHFIDEYADRINELLHRTLGATMFYKQEIVEVPGVVTALFITYDNVLDDSREVKDRASWLEFHKRLSEVTLKWESLEEQTMSKFDSASEKVMGGWEGRTIYFLKGGQHPEQWTVANADRDVISLLAMSATQLGATIQAEADHLDQIVPVGQVHFQDWEHMVRVIFNFLFRHELGEGQSQVRTEPEDEGVEIRDLIFANKAEEGFWKDLKQKYSASEIVVDAKNTHKLRHDDLRQLYCYLKPALGFWGFIVCRSEQPAWLHSFNRTLYKNFTQSRGVLVLCDDDLRRMVAMANKGRRASDYLQEKMSKFVRSI